MDFSAPHVGFVVAAYGITAIVLIGLWIGTVLALKALERALGALEERRAPRRRREP
jgi:heme exporter protein CcmD